jgi:hypothetical protein
MKKITLTMGMILSVMIFKASAQEENKTDFRSTLQLGLKVGANYSNVYDTKGQAFSADPKFGLATGVFLSVPLGKYIGVQPEILFSQKGFKATGMILGGAYSLTRTTSYIDVPILLALKPSEFLTLHIGPQFAYLIKQRDVFSNGITSVAQEKEFQNDNIRKNTMAFIVGADINLDHLVIGGRVGWDMLNNNGNGTSTTPRYKNTWFQVTLGYRFYSD